MRRVVLVAFPGVQTLDLTGPAEVFAAASRQLGQVVYRAEVTSVGGGAMRTTSACTVQTRDLRRLRAEPDDTVIVVGGEEAAIRAAVVHRPLLWLGHAFPVVRRMASVCSGAFVLAAAGILDGRRATTHWSSLGQLAAFRPAVAVDPNAIYVRDGTVWTSAGVTTGIDMALAMVEEDLGRTLADQVAGRLVLYARRPGFQSQFSNALLAQARGSDPLGPTVAWARAHLDEADPERLAKHAGLSVRTLHRRCSEQMGVTPAKLLETLRVEQARTLLATSSLAAKTIAASCGFATTARMKRAFERVLGVGPRDYRLLFAGGGPVDAIASAAKESG